MTITKYYTFCAVNNKAPQQAAMKTLPRSRKHEGTSHVNHKACRLLKCSLFYVIFEEISL